MPSKKRANENDLLIPKPSLNDIPRELLIDTHCHLLSTFTAFRSKFAASETDSIQSFARKYMDACDSIVDVWCEAPLTSTLEQIISVKADDWPFKYHFIIGVHPHNAKEYTDKIDAEIRQYLTHAKNVGIGEIGLDYHYDNSPRDIQKSILRRQLKIALESKKQVTIHTREADEDIYQILTEELPKDWRIHVHCYTDSLDLATKLLAHFENLVFGITGVVTYSSNKNTTLLLEHFATQEEKPRFVLETDSPFMVPTNASANKSLRLPLSHSNMIPKTADWIAQVMNQKLGHDKYSTRDICQIAMDNSKKHYDLQ